MPIPSLTTPTGALGISVSTLTNGLLQVDMVTTPDGDWAVLSGIDRLAQDVTLFLYRRVGSDPFDPTYGNALIDLLGGPLDDTTYASSVLMDSLKLFKARQAVEAQQGTLTPDEQADTFTITSISLNAGALVINLTVTSLAAVTVPVTASLPAVA